MDTYYFLHVAKTAGTSLRNYLEQHPKFRTFPHGLWNRLLREKTDDLNRYNMFIGHFDRFLTTYLGKSLKTFTFLRNPFDRAISHYEHARRAPHHFFHDQIRRQGSFLAFLRDPETRLLVRNFQTRQLGAVFDPAAMARTLTSEQLDRLDLERTIQTADTGRSDQQTLLSAKDCLTRCVAVGITEKMDLSLTVLADALGLDGIPRLKRLNTNTSQAPLTADKLNREEWSLLQDLVAVDWELYEFGLTLLQTRLSEMAWTRPRAAEVTARDISRGNSVEFHAGAAGVLCLRDGWGKADCWGVWSDGPRQSLVLPVRSVGQPLLVRCSVSATVPASGGELRLTILVNGRGVGVWTFSAGAAQGECEVLIPAQAMVTGLAPVLEFETLDGDAMPRSFGISRLQAVPVQSG